MWVVANQSDDTLFQLNNFPILAYGLALNDVVRAERRDDERCHFVEVVKPSGLLTVRVEGLHAEESRFACVVDLLKSRSVASELYVERYIAYAIERATFAEVEAALDKIITDDEELTVEIANE